MKRKLILALFAASLLLPFASIAAGHDHGGNHAMDSNSTAPAEAQMMHATVKKIDKAKGKITLSHDALSNGMPGMTMSFPVKYKTLLTQVKAGDSVLFHSESIKGVMTVVELKPAGN